MRDKLSIAIIGCGRFSKHFVLLFKAHHLVEEVYVCDLIRDRAERFAQNYGVKIIDTFEEALASDKINAIGIFTQRFSHGDLVIRALKAGKHVYSSVPCTVDVDEIREIEELVRKTRLTYSMGETGFYRAATVFCRQEYAKGTFGKFVYGASQYNHDIRNMENSYRSSGGDDWKKYAGVPPMFYPTHSTAMVLGAMPGVYAKRVMAFGYRDAGRTDIFGTDGQNFYDNPFANTTMLLELSNGGIARISENRSVAWKSPETFLSKFYGTDGGYEFSIARHHLQTWDPERPGRTVAREITKDLQAASVSEAIENDYGAAIQEIADGTALGEMAPVQHTRPLPKEFEGLPNRHNGTHHFLVDDFMRAYESGKLSPNNIWQAARFNIPGLMAHQSALQGGRTLDVVDLGDPPADWEVLPSDSV